MGALAWSMGQWDTAAEPQAAEAASLAYSPRLVEELRAEHRVLLKRYAEVERMVLEGRLAAIPHGLSALKAKLNVHTLREHLHCYTWLERSLARRPAELAHAAKLRADGDLVCRDVLEFIEQFRIAGVTRGTAQEFLQGLRVIGQVLLQRLQREETELFPLYRS